MLFKGVRKAVAIALFPEGEIERRSLERTLLIDEATGVANRRALDLALVSAETDERFGIVIFDGDNFGLANKEHGHSTGDLLINKIAHAIKGAASHYAMAERVFRFGGDEFVVIAPLEHCAQIAELACSAFGQQLGYVSLSAGYGKTFAEADNKLREKKVAKKTKKG